MEREEEEEGRGRRKEKGKREEMEVGQKGNSGKRWKKKREEGR